MRTLRVLFIAFLVCGIAVSCFAKVNKRSATISEIKGKVEMKTSAGSWEEAKVGAVLTQGDVIITKADSWATLQLSGAEEATVNVKPNSQLALAELTTNEKKGVQNTLLDLAMGEILIKTQKLHAKESKFEVKTPTSIVGVRGTVFSVTVESVK